MKYSFSVFFALLPFFSFCQNEKPTFPNSWEGKWAGTLEVFRDTGKVQELPMELHLLPIDTATTRSWTWTIIYGEDKEAGKRPYQLIEVDAQKGLYVIDEKNTIKVEGYFLGGAFLPMVRSAGQPPINENGKDGRAIGLGDSGEQ